MIKKTVLVLLTLGVFFVVVIRTGHAKQQVQAEAVVNAFVTAFNQRDIAAMLAWSTPDVHWYSISGEQIAIEAAGHEALESAMKSYFEQLPSARSALLKTQSDGNFVTAVEKASWKTQSEEWSSQCSVSVYQLSENKVSRVWYYPAYPCESKP